jgi:hypothetical protein
VRIFVVDGIVFWSKNPRPMLGRLPELRRYPYYFQFTLNGYGPDLEANLPPPGERVGTFWALSEKIGPEWVIWRYDPVILSDVYTVPFHLEYFELLARELHSFSKSCVISFVDVYRKLAGPFRRHDIRECSTDEMTALASGMARICRNAAVPRAWISGSTTPARTAVLAATATSTLP